MDDGMSFSGTSQSDFEALGSDMSVAACEMFNTTKTAITSAAQGDLIQCYVTTTFDNIAASNGIDIYDGEYHVFALSFTGSSFDEEEEDSGGPSKIKFKVVRDETSGTITQFEMFSCGDQGATDEQSMYLNQTILGSAFNMETINIGSGSQGDSGTANWKDRTTVAGTLNSSGSFVDQVDGVPTPKTITMEHQYDRVVNGEGQDDFFGSMVVSQSNAALEVEATFNGSHSFGNRSCSFTSLK
ncbi:hypothetical protein BVY03_05780 [bacterium K02(2017)]|nr:hypothetical protein BVY03_05780 [bacterium K02(2017)]